MSMHSKWRLIAALSLVVLVGAATGCSRKPRVVEIPPTQETKPVTEVVKTPEVKAETPVAATLELKDVFFDYDRFVLRDESREALNGNGKMLVDAAGAKVLLEGHCDERGTVEYNLALGERRANAVKGYLVQYGVDAGRISTISYGEERPFAPGNEESAWSQNRRVHFVKQ
jgi:peptidoglycan-associated lipoprotein